MNKKELRKMVRRAYVDLSDEYKKFADLNISKNILSLDECKNADIIFCFVGIGNEIDTIPLIKKLIDMGKTVCVPLCDENGDMKAAKIDSLDDLSPGFMDIPSPSSDATVIPLSDIGFSIIPCLTCNKKGYRLGYGGGYYDRFFANNSSPGAIVCREETIFTAIPTSSHDIKFNLVVSERNIYRS